MLRIVALALLASSSLAQQETFGKWCGKYYQIGAPFPDSRPDGSLFPYPQMSDQALLDFRCVTASSLYISGDDQYDPPMILVDANVTYDVGQPCKCPLTLKDDTLTQYEDHGATSGNLTVEVYIDGGQLLTSGSAEVDSMGTLLPFNTTSLKTQKTQYNLTCKATLNGQTFYANSTLAYLPPNPYGGNTVKIDRTSGALIVRNETAGSKKWEKIIPFGFYDVRSRST